MAARSAGALLALLMAAPLLTGCVVGPFGDRYSAPVDETVDIAGLTSVVVQNVNGDVTVTGENRTDVAIHAVKHAPTQADLANVHVSVSVDGGLLTVRVTLPSGFLPRGGADLDVRVPRDLAVRTVTSENGGVLVQGVAGDVHASTANGAVVVKDVRGVVSAISSNGAVTVRNTTGLQEARTSNGAVFAEVRAMAGDVVVRSSNGDATARIDPALAATVEVRTSNGDATVSGLTLADLSTSRSKVTGDLNGGGDRLTVATTNGDATLRPLG